LSLYGDQGFESLSLRHFLGQLSSLDEVFHDPPGRALCRLQFKPLKKTVVLVRVLCGQELSENHGVKQGLVFQPWSCAGFCAGKFIVSGSSGLIIFGHLAYHLI
jgi:hypothetical protein